MNTGRLECVDRGEVVYGRGRGLGGVDITFGLHGMATCTHHQSRAVLDTIKPLVLGKRVSCFELDCCMSLGRKQHHGQVWTLR